MKIYQPNRKSISGLYIFISLSPKTNSTAPKNNLGQDKKITVWPPRSLKKFNHARLVFRFTNRGLSRLNRALFWKIVRTINKKYSFENRAHKQQTLNTDPFTRLSHDIIFRLLVLYYVHVMKWYHTKYRHDAAFYCILLVLSNNNPS
jgi:hypothetical protein